MQALGCWVPLPISPSLQKDGGPETWSDLSQVCLTPELIAGEPQLPVRDRAGFHASAPHMRDLGCDGVRAIRQPVTEGLKTSSKET